MIARALADLPPDIFQEVAKGQLSHTEAVTLVHQARRIQEVAKGQLSITKAVTLVHRARRIARSGLTVADLVATLDGEES
jgi:hypothetical protein